MQARQRENEGEARKPPGIERNTQPDSAARRGPEGHLRFGKAAGQIHEPVSEALLDDRNDAVPLHGKISPAREYGRER